VVLIELGFAAKVAKVVKVVKQPFMEQLIKDRRGLQHHWQPELAIEEEERRLLAEPDLDL